MHRLWIALMLGMSAVVALCAVLALLWVPWLSVESNARVVATAGTAFQMCLTLAAMTVGAVWTYRLFFLHREKDSSGNLQVSVGHTLVSEPSRTLLTTALTLRNTGKVQISVLGGYVRVRRIVPSPDAFFASWEKHIPEGDSQVEWPLALERRFRCGESSAPGMDIGKWDIEPGEADEVLFDLLIPRELSVVRVDVYLCDREPAPKQLGWRTSLTYDLRSGEVLGRQPGQAESAKQRAGSPA